jgi:hypothetical protein
VTTAKLTVKGDHLWVTVEDETAAQKPHRDGVKESTGWSSETDQSEFFVSPLREPLTNEEVSSIWRRARE